MSRRARLLRRLTPTAFAWVFAASATAQVPCGQALALALDVSGSVDSREYRLQLDGLAAALDAPSVRRALLSQALPVEMLVFEWSGAQDQYIVIDWTALQSGADIAVFQETLRQTRRRESTPGTAIGHALEQGLKLLDQRKTCARRTLDISGDGKANMGPDPRDVRQTLNAAGITVNALVIGADSPGIGDLRQAEIGELSSYFSANVIVGADAFVQTSIGYDGYAEAMARKLERELQSIVVSGLSSER